MPLMAALALVVTALAGYFLLYTKPALPIRGPSPRSWIFGNLKELLLAREYGHCEVIWRETYGQVYQLRGCFGQSRLVVSDPAAIRALINGELAKWAHGQARIGDALFGEGSLFLARGARHKHLRGVMNPWFSQRSRRQMLPAMKAAVEARVESLDAEVERAHGSAFDIGRSFHKLALDVLGGALLEGMEAQSGGLADIQMQLAAAVDGVSPGAILANALLPYIPKALCRLATRLPLLREYHATTDRMSADLVQLKQKEQSADESFVGSLVHNGSFSRAEIAVHVRTMMIAGTETTGNTLSWIFYHLAQMPEYQSRLRDEIHAADDGAASMPLLNALINETLRLYPAFPLAERITTRDCVLPLSEPIRLSTGEMASEVSLREGQFLYISIAGYHRNKSLWGENADEFRPERWLGSKPPCKGPSLGPHASLLTFWSGSTVCIGYRFALQELYVATVELVRRFKFSLPTQRELQVRPVLSIGSKEWRTVAQWLRYTSHPHAQSKEMYMCTDQH
ncbi:Cytochrome P450 [Mycena kentingensis (nom. inval.)]|nr:Cytochrome P450 [Mycena kentingensis (nom. inval.)]